MAREKRSLRTILKPCTNLQNGTSLNPLFLLSPRLSTPADEGSLSRGAIRRDVIAKQHNLSDRQALALSHILVHGRVGIQDFERLSPRVSRRTLQRDLKEMVDKGLIAEKASSPTDPTKNYILAEIFSD